MSFFVGIFLILHGLVHLLYAGQAMRFFELKPGLAWPDDAWAFAKLLSATNTRLLASILLVGTALCFIAGGFGLFFQLDWWRTLAVGAAICSALVFLLFWDGSFKDLPGKGAVGVLISLAIVVVAAILKWPA